MPQNLALFYAESCLNENPPMNAGIDKALDLAPEKASCRAASRQVVVVGIANHATVLNVQPAFDPGYPNLYLIPRCYRNQWKTVTYSLARRMESYNAAKKSWGWPPFCFPSFSKSRDKLVPKHGTRSRKLDSTHGNSSSRRRLKKMAE